MNTSSHHHSLTRRTSRPAVRNLNRNCLRGDRRGPDDWSQALTAYGRSIKAHRRLARLAPRFFDAAVVDGAVLERAEQRRLRAIWEPILARVYGSEPGLPDPPAGLPPLPSLLIQHKVDYELAQHQLWLEAGHAAMARHQQRRPHEIPSWSRLIRLLKLVLALKRLAAGVPCR